MRTSLSQDKTRIAELDVLRGLAAMTVVFYHHTTIFQGIFGKGGGNAGIPYGVFAVHLFFMISGFVIFMTLSKARNALDFVVSRFSRLFPVFWAAVILTQTVVSLWPLPGLSVTWREALVNLTMIAEPLHVRLVDNVYWSLVIELTFYAIMLGLFLAGQLQRIEQLILPWLLLQVAAIFFVTELHQALPKSVYVLLLLRYAHLFLAGILFYRIRFDGSTRARQALLICCLATQFLVQGPWATLFALAFFALFYAMARQRLGWIALRPLVFLGTISYSLYLVHQNIGYVVMRALANSPISVKLLAALSTVVLISTFLTFAVEQPALRVLRMLYRRRRPTPCFAAVTSESAVPR